MAEAYAVVLRERVVCAYEAGDGSYPVIAARFALGEATVKRWVWRYRRDGQLGPAKKGGGTPSRITMAEVEALVTQLGDPTAGEITAAYNRPRRGRARVHVSTMKRALHRCGYVVKKTPPAAGGDSARRPGQAPRVPDHGPADSRRTPGLSRRIGDALSHEPKSHVGETRHRIPRPRAGELGHHAHAARGDPRGGLGRAPADVCDREWGPLCGVAHDSPASEAPTRGRARHGQPARPPQSPRHPGVPGPRRPRAVSAPVLPRSEPD